jgi:hypothetical protein
LFLPKVFLLDGRSGCSELRCHPLGDQFDAAMQALHFVARRSFAIRFKVEILVNSG